MNNKDKRTNTQPSPGTNENAEEEKVWIWQWSGLFLGVCLYPLSWWCANTLIRMCSQGLMCDPGVTHLAVTDVDLLPYIGVGCFLAVCGTLLSFRDYQLGSRFSGLTGCCVNILAIAFIIFCGFKVDAATLAFEAS